MLNFTNIFSGWRSLGRRVSVGEDDICYLFLPLHHTYGSIYNFMYSLVFGYSVYLAGSLQNMIAEMKTDLFDFVIEQNPDKDVYIIVSANGYEFANGERCYDVASCKEISFKDYDDYRKFILKSKEQKLKRNKKWYGE